MEGRVFGVFDVTVKVLKAQRGTQHSNVFDPQNRIDVTARAVVGAAVEVHRELGPGLLESVYESCLFRELEVKGLAVERQRAVPLRYRGEESRSDRHRAGPRLGRDHTDQRLVCRAPGISPASEPLGVSGVLNLEILEVLEPWCFSGLPVPGGAACDATHTDS